MEKSADAFRTISEVADDLTLPQHVLRFWETRFPQIRPLKRAGGRRYYRPADVVLLKTIRQLLYDDGYTIKGVQRLLKEQGPRALVAQAPTDVADAEPDRLSPQVSRPAEPPLAAPSETEPLIDAPSDGPSEAESAVERDALEEAIGTIDECLRILTAARPRP